MNVGIDLGTTTSLVAWRDGELTRLLPNGRGSTITPSVVGLDAAGELLVGEAARNQMVRSPERTVCHVKRRMGRRTTLELGPLRLSPEEVSAAVLAYLRRHAASFFGEAPSRAVVTVPAHFDDHQRLATIESALLAGFDSVRLLNEPTAAALPYATRERRRERVVVFDFGGGTLDVTCLEREGREFFVRSTVGDGALGGADIDRLVAQRVMDKLPDRLRSTVADTPHLFGLILRAAEQAKIDMAETQCVDVALPFLFVDGTPMHGNVTFHRDELAEIVAPLLERATALVDRAIAEARFDRSGFDHIVLAGGSSRLFGVRAMLDGRYGVPTAARINPEEVVATGAAWWAGNESGTDDAFQLRDVLSSTLAIELADGNCVPLVRKNEAVPVRRSRLFTTVGDDQTEAEIHLVQGNAPQAWRNRSLGRFLLSDIQPAPQGDARISVTVGISGDGIVTVHADDRVSGASRSMVARVRPETSRRAVAGSRGAYLASLLRRSASLRRLAEHDLRVELDEVSSLAAEVGRADDGAHRGDAEAEQDELIAVLEALIREIVISVEEWGQGESRGAAV